MSPTATPRRSIAALLACLATLLACGGPPPAVKPKREVILTSEDVDRKVGEDASVDVRSELGLIEDPALLEYVGAVGRRLARHAPRRRFSYHFAIVDQEAPNAFALPGGYIYVSRGLLTLTGSEDELANVIGHEIVHVAARHAAARQSVMQGLPTGLNWLQWRYVATYGRDQEREADRLGQGLAALAGYDPAGMATFLRKLENTERLELGSSRLPSFLATHPATRDRVGTAAARARLVRYTPQPPIAGDATAYLRRLEGLAVGTRAAEGVFFRDRFLHADLDFAMSFPPRWTTRNTHRAVGAISPKRDGQVWLEAQGPGEDPEAAAAKYIEELTASYGFGVEKAAPIKIGPYPAYRVFGRVGGRRGGAQVVFTWIVRDGAVFRVTGAAPPFAFDRYRGAFLNTARSFRPLRPAERARIRENRLRIVEARAGESLRALSDRTGNEWSLDATAVMNAVFVDDRLAEGQLVKIAVSRDYRAGTEAR